jgi:hypothetical protein
VSLTIVSVGDSRLRHAVESKRSRARCHAVHCWKLVRSEAQKLFIVVSCATYHPVMPNDGRPRPSLPGGEAEHVQFFAVGAQAQNLWEGASRLRCLHDSAHQLVQCRMMEGCGALGLQIHFFGAGCRHFGSRHVFIFFRFRVNRARDCGLCATWAMG